MNRDYLNMHCPLLVCDCTHTCMHAHVYAQTHVFHLTLNTELFPYIPGYFFFQNQACMHTRTCRVCLLLQVTKQTRGPSLLQWKPCAMSPHHGSIKEEQRTWSPDTKTLLISDKGQERNTTCRSVFTAFFWKRNPAESNLHFVIVDTVVHFGLEKDLSKDTTALVCIANRAHLILLDSP